MLMTPKCITRCNNCDAHTQNTKLLSLLLLPEGIGRTTKDFKSDVPGMSSVVKSEKLVYHVYVVLDQGLVVFSTDNPVGLQKKV